MNSFDIFRYYMGINCSFIKNFIQLYCCLRKGRSPTYLCTVHTVTHLPKGCHLKSHTYTFLRFYSLLNWQLGIEMTFFLYIHNFNGEVYKINRIYRNHLSNFPQRSANSISRSTYIIWQYRLWSFQGQDKKLERFLAVVKWNHWVLHNWFSGEVSKSDKFWLSKSIFCVKNHRNLSLFFIEEYEFRSTFFLFYNITL